MSAKPFSRNFDKQVEAVRSLFGRQLVLEFTGDDVKEALEPLKEMYDSETIERVGNLIRVRQNKYNDLMR